MLGNLFPVQASTMAPRVDALFLTLVGMTACLGLLIGALVIGFAVKYRRRSPHDVGDAVLGHIGLEITWSAIPVVIVLIIFVWSSHIFVAMASTPPEGLDVYVVAKQWMWETQHINGQSEINRLHVPVGRVVRLTLTSQDVIHDFFMPAFRLKADVLPGRYTRLWFLATKVGDYHLFCAEYCGTNHSAMIGTITVMPPDEFEAWLRPGDTTSLAAAGQQLFHDLACDTCHSADSGERGPDLRNLYGSTVRLADGSTVVADDTYLRASLLTPQSQIVAGYAPLMPTFQGLLTEQQVIQLHAYIRSLAPPADRIQP